MKKYGCFILVGVLVLSLLLTACNRQPVNGESESTGTTIATTTVLQDTGGDYDACKVHSFEYHNIDGYLLDLVTQEETNAFIEKYKGEDMTIVAFVEYFGITREQFIEAMRWEDKLDMKAMYHGDVPYTYGQFVDAIYGDDEELTAWVFAYETTHPEKTVTDDVFLMESACPVHNHEYHRFNGELIEYVGEEKWKAYCEAYGDKGEEANILTFLAFCEISRDEYIKIMGWENSLGHDAVEHGMGYEYTCGDFVEALYGDDEAFREYMFSWEVFPMLNPAATQ